MNTCNNDSKEKYETNPPGWGGDELTKFIDMARHNIFATFFHNKPYFELLSQIDHLFKEFIKIMSGLSDEKMLESSPASFLGRAYGCYLAGVRLSTSGQLTEAYILFRGCLENALYAFYIENKPEFAVVWRDRYKSEQHKKRVRGNFTIGKMIESLNKKNPKIGKFAKELYDKTIDYGGHPNIWSIASNIKFVEEKGKWVLDIFNNDELLLPGCLLVNARTGLCSLSIFRLIYPDQFKKAGIPKKLFSLYNRMSQLSQQAVTNWRDEDGKDESN